MVHWSTSCLFSQASAYLLYLIRQVTEAASLCLAVSSSLGMDTLLYILGSPFFENTFSAILITGLLLSLLL